MDVLRLFLIAAFSIKNVASLPQDWSIFDPYSSDPYSSDPYSSDPSPYELTYPEFEVASAFPPVPLYSSLDDQVPYLEENAFDDLEWVLGTDLYSSDGELQWDDPYYNPPLELFAAGCSGAIGKREDEAPASCPLPEEPPCPPDKAASCCTPTDMEPSNFGGFNMNGCTEVVTLEACVDSGGSVQCCTPERNALSILSGFRWGCTTSKSVSGNRTPSAPRPPKHEELKPPPSVPEPVPESVPLDPLVLPNGFGGF
jgi:hypothetical protein